MARLQLDAVLRLVDISINPSVFKRISQATASMPKNIRVTTQVAKQLNVEMRQVGRTMQATSQSMVGMNRVAKTFLQRMAQFAILLPTFATLNRAIQGGVRFLVDFETEMAKIIRIDPTNLRDRMDEIAASAFDTAKAFGSTADKVIGSIRIFKQAGDTISEAQDKARVATLAATVTTLDLVQAQELLIGVSKQFADEGLTNIEVLDKITKIEDSAAVSAQDLAEALKTGGNALAFATRSFDDTLGFIAALREQTRKSGREIGTFGKTLSTRLLAAGDARNAVESLGVTIANLDGTLRPLGQILEELSVKFNALAESQKPTVAKAIAGIRQFESLLATMKALSRMQELSATTTTAQGTAQKQLTVTSQTLQFQLNQMIASFQELAKAAGDAGITDIFKDAVNFASLLAGFLKESVGFADKLGIAIAPLLALGAIKLGKSIFGVAGGGGAAALGASSVAAARQIQILGTTSTQTAAQMMGMATPLVAAGKKQATAITKAGKVLGVLAVATVAATALDALANAIDTSTEGQKDFTAETVRSVGSAAQTGIMFGLLNKKAGFVAGAFSIVVDSALIIAAAIQEEIKARKEINKLNDQELKRKTLIEKGGDLGVFEKVRTALDNEISRTGGPTGNTIANVTKEIRSFVRSIEELEGIEDIGSIISSPEFIRAIAEYDDSFVDLQNAIADGVGDTTLLSVLFKNVTTNINKSTEAAADFVDSLIVMAASLDQIQELRKVAELERELVEQRLELAKVTSTSIQLFAAASDARKKELDQLRQLPGVAQDTINNLTRLASEAPVQINFTKPLADKFVEKIIIAFKEAGGKASKALATVLAADKLTPAQQKFSKQLITALKAQQDEELAIRTAGFELRKALAKEEFDIQQATFTAAQRATEMFDELRVGLIELGAGVGATADDLGALQNLNVTDLKAILDGTSELGDNIKNAVLAIAGDDVVQAEAAITASSEATRVALEALKNELDSTESALDDVKSGFSQFKGKSVKDLFQKANDLRTAIAEKQSKNEIELAKLGINRAQAVKEAEEDAAKQAQELQEAMSELATAQKDVKKETKDVAKAFKDFVDSKIADFSSDNADAQTALQDAQKEVLGSTEELADSYTDLNQAILDFNDNMAGAVTESNLLGVQIQQMTGGITTFQGRLSALSDAFGSVLNDANISLSQRIDLERQLAQETLGFLQSARAEITSAGINVFGQTGQENQALQEGIAGLNFIAEKLGGSFKDFLNIDPGAFNKLSNELLNLPVEFRKKILDALGTLPSTVSVGGFSVDQLQTAIGQLGAGVSPEEGLPSVEELIEQETAQIEELRDLAIKDADLQLATVLAAQEQVDLAKAQLDEAEIMRERAEENAISVREAIREEKAVLDVANEQRQFLTDQVLAATDQSALDQIQAQAEKFAEQNKVFDDIGQEIVTAIEALATVQAQALTAAADIPSTYGGYIPNFARGSLSGRETAGLLRAAAREKRHMPSGAGLAVANTSEAIIPNFQGGNISPIAAGVSAAKGINETVVAAISRSVGQAIADVVGANGGADDTAKKTVDVLGRVLKELQDISASNSSISTNTDPAEGTSVGGPVAGGELIVNITTNQRDTVQITGLDNLVDQLREGIRQAQESQAGAVVQQLESVVADIARVLRDRGIISSLGQPG